MRLSISAMLDYTIRDSADVLLQLEVAPDTHDQVIHRGHMTVSTGAELHPFPAEEGFGRRTWTQGAGHFRAEYNADVTIERERADIAGLQAMPYHKLPQLVVPYLWPSRYCQSDRFEIFVGKVFGDVAGGDKIIAMNDWIDEQLDYVPGTSDGTTTAVDTFTTREGICRDYAHLLITFARAAGIPARMVSAYGLGVEPQDFHAVVEVWLDDKWHLIDPSRLAEQDGLARIVVGRDATDIAFMTIFGSAQLNEQKVSVERVD
ncbi:MAG: transglutaminase family protein [Parasphingopyxis sp.]|uniref:transglutaminase-like domain-containing protein n=1 Tax=Parasphingopyxis sp. TaxID=1920299 RepID=UPI00261FF4AD|nr:transglutaminase family protein [uncultured Parasphingopyxis sp.]